MTPNAVRRVGSQALIAELGTLDAVLALHACMLEHPLPGQVDLIPAASTLLIQFDWHRNAAHAVGRLTEIDAPAIDDQSGRQLTIEVVYDGEDLAAVGTLTGLGVDGVIEAHTGQLWRAAFSGFAPGFVYLAGANNTLDVPRRDSPRTAVPAGSVAIAGYFSAVYPRRSPGGWQLIGRTNARVWDIHREEPAMIQAGDSVRYVAVDRFSDAPCPSATCAPPSHDDAACAIEIVNPGMQSLIEDLGRPGLSHLGVSPSGAADEASARQANRLVGNTPDDAVIETVLGGLTVRARGDQVLALTGAGGNANISGPHGARAAPMLAPFVLYNGETLELAHPSRGLRRYLGVRGGIDIAPVLQSRSSDTLSGIGPAPLAVGNVLPVGPVWPSHIVGTPEPSTLADRPKDGTTTLRAVLGPRHDWFDDDSLDRFTRLRWRTSEQSNRVGVRLTLDREHNAGAPLARSRQGELDSEGTVAGAIQVPPSGLPVLFLKDHPVTGGYPVIAAVIAADLPRAAQLAPGDVVRFSIVDPIDSIDPNTQSGHKSGMP